MFLNISLGNKFFNILVKAHTHTKGKATNGATSNLKASAQKIKQQN